MVKLDFEAKKIIGWFEFRKSYYTDKICSICGEKCENGKIHIRLHQSTWMHITCVMELHKHIEKAYKTHELEIISKMV
jgi:hypothetical protein